MLDRRNVDVDADRARSHCREERRAVTFAASCVENAPPRGEAPREGVTVPVLVGDFAGTAGEETLARELEFGGQVAGRRIEGGWRR